MGQSMMEKLALLPESERAEILAGIDMDALMWDWSAWARPEQRPPDGTDWSVWMYLAGRGCVSGDTKVYNPKTDQHIPAKDLVGVSTWVQTPYGPQFVEEGVYVKGIDNLWDVLTPSGKKISATLEHKFLSNIGWKTLSNLKVGDYIATETSKYENDLHSVEHAYVNNLDSQEFELTGFDPKLGWEKIESIKFSHVGVFYDITVPKYACYYAGGFLNHNSGKTRSAAEWMREKARTTKEGQLRFLAIARTAADIRDTVVEGESGILNICPPSEMPHYEPSKRRLTWPNGNMAVLLSADEPDSARGVQSHYTWADELAAWRQTPDAAGMTSWDNVRVATRLGLHPQIVATTTPKRVPILYSLIAEAEKTGRVVISKGSTMDNSGNLSEAYLDAITGVYAGTRLAQQELYGEMLDDVEGALWTIEMLEEGRQGMLPPSAPLRCIGVDPSVAENPRDECGIIVCASTADRELYKRHAWVMEDASVHGSPEVWANKVVEMARRWGAPVVAEVNQGGALVRNAINAIDPNVKVLEVHSKYGKALRAEPIVLAYEQKRIHHVGYLTDLESQMTSWIPGETKKSPDRVDALVHAMTALLIKPPQGFHGGKLTAKSPAARRIPSERQGPPSPRGGRVFFR